MSITGNESEFFLTLLSNASPDVFKDNTLANFKVQLPYPITLKGEYVVGLKEFHYPYNWSRSGITLDQPDDELSMRIYTTEGTGNDKITPTDHIHSYAAVSSWTTYESSMCLVDHINRETVNKRTAISTDPFFFATENPKEIKPKITHDRGRFTVYNHVDKDKYVRLKLSPSLAHKLGFGPSQFPDVPSTVEHWVRALHPVVAVRQQPFDYLMVYCDVVTPSIVGHMTAPLLRVISCKGRPGETISTIFERPLFFKVSRNRFQVLEVRVAADDGSVVKFASGHGRVICVLHFKKVL